MHHSGPRVVAVASVALLSAAACFTPTAARADGSTPFRLVPDLTPPWSPRDHSLDAAPSSDPWDTRPRSLMLAGGAGGGPLGYGGLAFDWAPTRWLVFGAGGGYSGSGITGAIMPRLRLPLTRWFAVGFGVPFSAGPYEYVAQAPESCPFAGCSVAYKTTRTWDIAFWLHLEPNIEFRLPSGIALRLYAGRSSILNAHGDVCTSTLTGGCPSDLGETKYYGGVALGYAF
jgi:hypothetical protein